MIYVHHHLGLGDHIVCNAIVRNMYKQYGKIMLAVKNHNYISVKNLYSDLNIEFHKVNSDEECFPMYNKMPFIRIGFEHCRNDWEKSFYDQVGIPYYKRFSDFYIQRNFKREFELKDKLKLPIEYSFANIKASTGDYKIEIKSNYPIIYLSEITDNIFDWIPIILEAKEIHTIETSIFHLIKQLNVKCKKTFYNVRKSSYVTTFEDDLWELKNETYTV